MNVHGGLPGFFSYGSIHFINVYQRYFIKGLINATFFWGGSMIGFLGHC